MWSLGIASQVQGKCHELAGVQNIDHEEYAYILEPINITKIKILWKYM